MARLVVGHHALLVVGDHPARLHAGHHPLERRLEVASSRSLSRRSRPAKMAASLQMLARSAPVRPLVWRATSSRSMSSASGLPLRVHAEDLLAPREVGRGHEDLAVEATGPQQRGVQLVEQVRGARSPPARRRPPKPSSSTSSWLSVWSFSPDDVVAARGADRVELVDEHDRRRGLARLAEQPPDARRAEAREHLHERRRGLREEPGVGLVGHRLGQQRLARAGRAVEQDPLRAPWRRAAGTARGRAGTPRPRAARPWPPRRRPRRPSRSSPRTAA